MVNMRCEQRTGDMPVLYIFDAIGDDDGNGRGVTIGEVTAFLNEHRGAPKIRVEISSTGGSAWTAMAIYDALSRFPGEVHTYGSGIVASAASIIFLAGSVRTMASNCQLMIHHCSTAVEGGRKEIESAIQSLDQTNASMEAVISQRTGKASPVVSGWLEEEKWFTAQEARQFGFVTDISDAVPMTAQLDVSRFRNAPQAVQALRGKPPEKTEPAAPIEEALQLMAHLSRKEKVEKVANHLVETQGVKPSLAAIVAERVVKPVVAITYQQAAKIARRLKNLTAEPAKVTAKPTSLAEVLAIRSKGPASMTAAQQVKAYGKPKSMTDIYKIQRGEKLT